MNPLLQHDTSTWQRIGGLHTAEEIAQQPRLWRQLAQDLPAHQAQVESFLGDWLQRADHRVILTGAGSSAFGGELVADELNAAWAAEVRAVSTTSLLTHPELYLDAKRPTLLVSFARSGNSPESTAAVALLRKSVLNARFLNITCNAEGALAVDAAAHADTSLNLLMPAGSCDRGFAMTSSFSCMLLATLAVLGPESVAAKAARLNQLADLGEQALRDWAAPVGTLAAEAFDRIIYLGSGPLEALAREGALKVLELSSGRALALPETPLGFRHGPKSALAQNALVICLRSVKPIAQRYEQDLLDELRRDAVAGRVLSIGPTSSNADLALPVQGVSDAWAAPLWLIAAQLFSLNKSAALGLTPDNPFPDGTVNRVVQGVVIHD